MKFDLQPLFTEDILEQTEFPELHPGHASYVWHVRTVCEDVVVRASRMTAEPADEFWWGCRALFGVDPTDVFALESLNNQLKELSLVPVPQVIRTGVLNEKEFVVVERMPGHVVHSFHDIPEESLSKLGESIARIHSNSFESCGNVNGTLRYGLPEFHERVAQVMEDIVHRFFLDDSRVCELLPSFSSLARELPPPEEACLIMLDMDPTQFLWDGKEFTALIDTEVYGIGPRCLELVAMEYLLNPSGAAAFKEGYSRILSFPYLAAVRPVYRYLNLLLSVQGRVDIDVWMNWPKVFDI